jgi:hypothetical protein
VVAVAEREELLVGDVDLGVHRELALDAVDVEGTGCGWPWSTMLRILMRGMRWVPSLG